MSRKHRTNLTNKQELFVMWYCQTLNATESARRAGYKGNDRTLAAVGYENLGKPHIRKYIDDFLDRHAMSAAEVVQRLAGIARGSIASFLNIDPDGRVFVDLNSEQAIAAQHLIRKLKQREVVMSSISEERVVERTIEIELHDAKDAAVQLAKILGLHRDRVDVSVAGRVDVVAYIPDNGRRQLHED